MRPGPRALALFLVTALVAAGGLGVLAQRGLWTPSASPLETRAAAPPGPPASVLAFAQAVERGEPLPLQDLLSEAEAFRGVSGERVRAAAASSLPVALASVLEASGIPAPAGFAQATEALSSALPADLRDALAVLAGASVSASSLAREAYAGDVPDWAIAFRAQRLKLAAVEATLPTLVAYGGASFPGASIDVCGVLRIDAESKSQKLTCNYTLDLDLGGDDEFTGNAGGTFLLDTSALAVHVAGNTFYNQTGPDHVGFNGGGVKGLGTLVDVGGDDRYVTFAGEGAALNGAGNMFGVGTMIDLGGDDVLNATASLHASANGGGWASGGLLVLVGGTDLVSASTPGAGALNGGGWLGAGALVAVGGSRHYFASDHEGGAAANGAAVLFSSGLLADWGGNTRYEADFGTEEGGAANGAASGGASARLFDFGGGDDVYVSTSNVSSSNGGSRGGTFALLLDDGGTDLYYEAPDAPPAKDETQAPKGRGGARLDLDLPTVPPPAEPVTLPSLVLAPAAAHDVLEALAAAEAAGWSPASLADVQRAALGAPAPASTVPRPPALGIALADVSRLLAAPPLPAAALAALAAAPPDLREALAGLLDAYADAVRLVREAPPTEEGPGGALDARARLLSAVERARPALLRHSGGVASAPVEACGYLSIDLTGASREVRCEFAIQISLGGNTVYRNRAGGTPRGFPVGFLVDAGGNDLYPGPENRTGMIANGGGIGGVGFLADLAGNDRYELTCGGICIVNGGAVMGAGALLDAAGDDVYAATAPEGVPVANGAALLAGAGLLADHGGNDRYLAEGLDATSANGAVFLGGTGLLFDAAGDDAYDAKGGEHATLNGAATGGTGILIDLAGDDSYRGEATHHGMVNGGGFFAAPLSLLLDGGGNDAYEGVGQMDMGMNGHYYTIGKCGTLYGCGLGFAGLVDASGRDQYVEWLKAPPGLRAEHEHGHGHAPPDANSTGHDANVTAPRPAPTWDATQAPKGDVGAQLDLGLPETLPLRVLLKALGAAPGAAAGTDALPAMPPAPAAVLDLLASVLGALRAPAAASAPVQPLDSITTLHGSVLAESPAALSP